MVGVDFANVWDALFTSGVAILVLSVLVLLIAALRPSPTGKKTGMWVGIAVLVVAALFMLTGALGSLTVITGPSSCTPGTSGCPNPNVQGSVIVSVVTTNFHSGQSYNTGTGTIYNNLVYNKTATCLASAATNVSTWNVAHPSVAGCYNNTLIVTLNLARSDSNNVTYGFSLTVNGINTLLTTSNPTAYSWIGYKASATGGVSGQWQMSWGNGAYAGITPTQAAPATTSGVAPNIVGVSAFGSHQVSLYISLGGSNSTAATWGTLAQQYVGYTMTINISGGAGATPAAIPIVTTLIGIHA